MKVGIIGMGKVGSSIAFSILTVKISTFSISSSLSQSSKNLNSMGFSSSTKISTSLVGICSSLTQDPNIPI